MGLPDTSNVRCRHRDHATAGFLPAVGAGWCGARDVEVRTQPTIPRAAAPHRARKELEGMEGELGSGSPQAMTMQMMRYGAQATTVAAY